MGRGASGGRRGGASEGSFSINSSSDNALRKRDKEDAKRQAAAQKAVDAYDKKYNYGVGDDRDEFHRYLDKSHELNEIKEERHDIDLELTRRRARTLSDNQLAEEANKAHQNYEREMEAASNVPEQTWGKGRREWTRHSDNAAQWRGRENVINNERRTRQRSSQAYKDTQAWQQRAREARSRREAENARSIATAQHGSRQGRRERAMYENVVEGFAGTRNPYSTRRGK